MNRFTGITQTRHFVLAITVDDSVADPQTRFRLGDETPAPHMRFGKLSTKEIAAFKAIKLLALADEVIEWRGRLRLAHSCPGRVRRHVRSWRNFAALVFGAMLMVTLEALDGR